jgi:hypothetical protein
MWEDLLLLVSARPGHQLTNSLTGPLVAVKDGVDLFGDGHLYAIARSEAECGRGGPDAFSNLSAHAGENVVELTAAAEFDTDRTVP